LMRKTG